MHTGKTRCVSKSLRLRNILHHFDDTLSYFVSFSRQLFSEVLFSSFLKNIFNFFFFLPCRVAWKILVPQSGIELALPAVEEQSPSHWTTREAPIFPIFFLKEEIVANR